MTPARYAVRLPEPPEGGRWAEAYDFGLQHAAQVGGGVGDAVVEAFSSAIDISQTPSLFSPVKLAGLLIQLVN